MATKFLNEAQRGASRGTIDLPIAAVAGLAVGFVAFMLPGDILARLIEMSGLPQVFPPAAPPLGTKAQAAFALAAAGAASAAIYFLLRLLGGERAAPKARVWPEVDTEREPETPRLRRSDVHPDAPARRPILAARELGEPDAAPAPIELPQAVPAEPEPEFEAAAAIPEDGPLDLGGPGTEMLQAEPEPAVVAGPPVEEIRFSEAIPAERAEPTVQPGEPDPVGEAGIDELMARLERGLARRAGRNAPRFVAPAEPSVPAAASVPAPSAEEWGDDRLRSAIENLQKMAARAG